MSCSGSARRPKTISPARPSHHDAEGEHDHDDFDTFVVDFPLRDDADTLIDRLARRRAAHDILRIKGFVEVAGKPMRLLVQGVGRASAALRPALGPDEPRRAGSS